MPAKTIHPIGDQSGGKNNFSNSRDIDDRQYVTGVNIDSSVPGEIRCVGEWGYYFIDAATSGFSAITHNPNNGTNDLAIANTFASYTGPVGDTEYEIIIDSENTNPVTASTISFTYPNIIANTTSDWASSYTAGDKLRISGSASNSGDYTVDSVSTLTMNISSTSGVFTEAAGSSVTVEKFDTFKWRTKPPGGSWSSFTGGVKMSDSTLPNSLNNGIKISWGNVIHGHVKDDKYAFTASVSTFEDVKPGYGIFPFQTDFNHASPAVATEGYYLAVAKTIANDTTDLKISMYHQPQLGNSYVTDDVITIPHSSNTNYTIKEDLSAGATADFIWVDGALRIFDASLTGDDHNFFPYKWRLQESGLTYFKGAGSDDTSAIANNNWKTTRQELPSPTAGKVVTSIFEAYFVSSNADDETAAVSLGFDWDSTNDVIDNADSRVSLLIMTDDSANGLTTHTDEVGWGRDSTTSADYYFYYSYLYENSQESLPFQYADKITLGGGANTKYATFLPFTNPGGGASNDEQAFSWDTRITGVRMYYRRADRDSDIKYFIGEFQVTSLTSGGDNVAKYIDGMDTLLPALIGDGTGNPENSNASYKDVGTLHETPPTIFTHATMSGIRDETTSIACKYKTATLVNRRLYVGNIKQKTKESDGIEKKYPDRIIKSLPNKFDTLPDTEFIDVAIRDGEEIIKLESLGSRLLQFKQNTLYTIAVAGGEEYLDGSYKNMGVSHPHAVTKTDFGIFWVNDKGAYLYTGEKAPINLIDGKLNLKYWRDWITKDAITGYIPKEKKFVVINNATDVWGTKGELGGADWLVQTDMLIYNVLTQSWNECTDVVGTGSPLDAVSNIVNYIDSNKEINTLLLVGTDSLYEYRTVEDIDNNSRQSRSFQLKTKDIHAGAPHVRKKFYKAYITYKGLGYGGSIPVGSTAPVVQAIITSTTGYNTVNLVGSPSFSAGTSYDNWRTAEYKIDNTSTSDKANSRNAYSVQLVISGDDVYQNFKINDISLVFRPKSVK